MGQTEAERRFMLHDLRCESLRWLELNWAHSHRLALRIGQVPAWECDPIAIEGALLMAINSIELWGPKSGNPMAPEVDDAAVRARRVEKWSAPMVEDLVKEVRQREEICSEWSLAFGESRDIVNYAGQQKRLVLYREHLRGEAEARQNDLDDVLEQLGSRAPVEGAGTW